MVFLGTKTFLVEGDVVQYKFHCNWLIRTCLVRENFGLATVALMFVFDNYCLTMD